MKYLFSLLTLSLTFLCYGQKIHEIVPGKYTPGLRIIKYKDGSVNFVQEGKKLQTSTILATPSSDSDPILKSFQGTRPLSRDVYADYVTPHSIYEPTVLLNYSVAKDVMNEMNRHYIQGSQCYDRAHIWSFEENKKYGTLLMKAFLFFSDDYIERYKFPWWFHVAPYAYLKMNGALTERILDPVFAQYPLKFKLWTDLFMKNKVECKSIDKYSSYDSHPHEDDCYLFRTSMYYWQPQDLEVLENDGLERSGFFDQDIQWAYEHGFSVSQ